jgi:hypothetical protein
MKYVARWFLLYRVVKGTQRVATRPEFKLITNAERIMFGLMLGDKRAALMSFAHAATDSRL